MVFFNLNTRLNNFRETFVRDERTFVTVADPGVGLDGRGPSSRGTGEDGPRPSRVGQVGPGLAS